MEPESSLLYSQVPATSHLSWANSIQSPQPPPTSWRSILILSSHLHLGLPIGLSPSGFPSRTLCTSLPCPIHTTCPAHLILHDFTTRTIQQANYTYNIFNRINQENVIGKQHIYTLQWHLRDNYKDMRRTTRNNHNNCNNSRDETDSSHIWQLSLTSSSV